MTQVEQAYAQGLYALAQEENITEELMQQLTILEETVGKDREYLDLLSTPALSKDERCQVLDRAFRDQVHIYVLNFMKILTEKGYIRHFSGCCRAFRQQYNQDRGILPVRAVSAVMLSDTQKSVCSRHLSSVPVRPYSFSAVLTLLCWAVCVLTMTVCVLTAQCRPDWTHWVG